MIRREDGSGWGREDDTAPWCHATDNTFTNNTQTHWVKQRIQAARYQTQTVRTWCWRRLMMMQRNNALRVLTMVDCSTEGRNVVSPSSLSSLDMTWKTALNFDFKLCQQRVLLRLCLYVTSWWSASNDHDPYHHHLPQQNHQLRSRFLSCSSSSPSVTLQHCVSFIRPTLR